jgi:hypothetical protein
MSYFTKEKIVPMKKKEKKFVVLYDGAAMVLD